MLAHLRSYYGNVEAYFGNYQWADPVNQIGTSALCANLPLLLSLNFTNHGKRNLEILESLYCVLALEIAVCELVTHIDVDHWIFVNNFIFNCFFRVLKLINGVIDLAAIHNTLGITCFGSYIVIDSKLKNPLIFVGRSKYILELPIVYLPSIVHFTNIIENTLCLLIMTLAYETLPV